MRMTFMRAFFMLWLLLAGFTSLEVTAAVIQDIRMSHAPERSRIVLDMTLKSDITVFALDEPARVVIDLDQVTLQARIPPQGSTGHLIERIRQGSPDRSTTRLVFDLAQPVRFFVRWLKPSSGYQYRLVVDFHLYFPDPDQPQIVKTTEPSANRDCVVIVDPGHGGKDPGALGKSSQEKELNLRVAKRLKKMIDAKTGIQAVLTRSTDRYLTLGQRAAIAKRHRAHMFISIHANAFTNPTPRGASVFALSPGGEISAVARRLANRHNQPYLAGGASLKGRDSQTAQSMVDMSMETTDDSSLLLGREVLSELKKIGRIHSPRVEKAGFGVLKSPSVPSILVETGFITNPDDERLLKSAQYQKRLADAILKGIDRYLENNPSYYYKTDSRECAPFIHSAAQ